MNTSKGTKLGSLIVIMVIAVLTSACADNTLGRQVAVAASLPQEPEIVKVPVYLLVYSVTGVDVESKALEIMEYLTRGTQYHGESEAYLQFEVYKVAAAKSAVIPKVKGSDLADYEAIFSDNGVDDLCELARNGEIKQIWVWSNGFGGMMREAVDNGPIWDNSLGTNVPDCGVQVTTVASNINREPQFAVEAHMHRYEQFFTQRFEYAFNKKSDIEYEAPGYRCENSEPDDPWGWCVEDFIAGYFGVENASTNGYTRGASDGGDIAGCGWAHFPPNVTWEYRQEHGDDSRYVYDYTGSVRSACRNWRLDVAPEDIAEEISCTAWGCDQPGNNNQAEYFVWWMQNIPGPNNVNFDELGNQMPNWWAALYPEG